MRTDEQTNMTKLIVAFRNFAEEHKMSYKINKIWNAWKQKESRKLRTSALQSRRASDYVSTPLVRINTAFKRQVILHSLHVYSIDAIRDPRLLGLLVGIFKKWTSSMSQRYSWEANSRWACQDIPRFYPTSGSLPCSREPAAWPDSFKNVLNLILSSTPASSKQK